MAAPDDAQPGSLPRRLASVDKKVRDRAVDLLARWLECRRSVEDGDLRKIWKGLFYCYWHSDKAHVQADLAEHLAALLLRLRPELGLRYFEEFLGTMRREWGGIDQLRLDKFYLLQRKFVSGVFKTLQQQDWNRELVTSYMNALKERSFLADDMFPAQGSSMHLAEVFLDELGPVFPDEAEVVGILLDPFLSVIALSLDKTFVKRVKESVFDRLLEKAKERLDRGEDGEDQLGWTVLQLPLAERLFQFAGSADTPQGSRKLLYSLWEQFKKLKKAFEETKPHSAATSKVKAKSTSGKKKSAGKSSKAETQSLKAENSMDIDPVRADDPVISNLESKFEVVAGEENDAGSLPPLEMVLSPLIAGNKKKSNKTNKKKKQSVLQSESMVVSSLSSEQEHSPADSPGKKRKRDSAGSSHKIAVSPINTASKKKKSSKDSPETENVNDTSNSAKKAKKVRFALKKNTIWKPTSPRSLLPAKLTSTSTGPKTSALKKGLSPGPIRPTSPKRVLPRSKKQSPKRLLKSKR